MTFLSELYSQKILVFFHSVSDVSVSVFFKVEGNISEMLQSFFKKSSFEIPKKSKQQDTIVLLSQ